MGLWVIVLFIVVVLFMLFQAEWTYIKAEKTKKQLNNNVRKEE